MFEINPRVIHIRNSLRFSPHGLSHSDPAQKREQLVVNPSTIHHLTLFLCSYCLAELEPYLKNWTCTPQKSLVLLDSSRFLFQGSSCCF